MIQLRSNQIEPVKIGTEFFLNNVNQPSLMVEPVAFGKSIVIAQIVKNIEHTGKTLVLQPSKELLAQNYNKYISLGGEASIFSASLKQKSYGNVTYATIGSIKSLGSAFKELGYKYLIIDEADRYPRDSSSMLGGFLKSAGIKAVLGFTATPFKLQNGTNPTSFAPMSKLVMLTTRNKHGTFWKDIIHVTQISDIIRDGYWSLLNYETHEFNSEYLIYNSNRSEYTDESIERAYSTQNIEEKVVHRIANLDRKKILVFVHTVAQAMSLANKIPNSVAIYGNMPAKDREKALLDFKESRKRVAINVNVLSVGYDEPNVDCIIQARATSSLSLYYQQQGRGVRLGDKSDCLIIDFVGGIDKFGPISFFKFVYKSKWIMTSEDRILTDIPIDEIGKHIYKNEQTPESEKVIIDFGKFKGKEVKDTPLYWREWMLQNFRFTSSTFKIKKELIRLNEN